MLPLEVDGVYDAGAVPEEDETYDGTYDDGAGALVVFMVEREAMSLSVVTVVVSSLLPTEDDSSNTNDTKRPLR